MTPIKFKRMNCTYVGEGCGDLPVHGESGQIVSCWRLLPFERIRVLFTGRVWLSILSHQQPPVWMGIKSPFNKK